MGERRLDEVPGCKRRARARVRQIARRPVVPQNGNGCEGINSLRSLSPATEIIFFFGGWQICPRSDDETTDDDWGVETRKTRVSRLKRKETVIRLSATVPHEGHDR